MKNILVAINFEDKESSVLLKKAVEISEKFGSKIWIVHIAMPNPEFIGYDVGPQHVRDFRAKELKKEHKIILKHLDDLRAKNIECDGFLIQGAATDAILKESEKLGIDLIIHGHHKHGLLYKIFVNDVDGVIVNESKVPVLIIPLDK